MPKFSQKSLDKLNTCHPDLQKLFNEVIKHWDCTILEGHRDQATQDEYFRTGKSKLKYPNGKHNKTPSMAVDVIPYYKNSPNIRWDDINGFAYFSGFVLGVAAKMGIKIRHGADWNGDRETKDHSFIDWPHFELIE